MISLLQEIMGVIQRIEKSRPILYCRYLPQNMISSEMSIRE